MTVRAAWVCLVLVVWVVVGTGEGVEEFGNDGVGVEHEIALDEDYPGEYQDYPVDYHYGDERYSEYLSDLKNVTLRKCRCNGEQYSDDDGKCHQATTTYVIVVNPHRGEHVAAPTSDLGNVKVGSLTCPPNHHLVTLDSNLGHYFSLLVSGGLVWEAQLFQEYCVVHTLDPSTGRPEAWQANICIPTLPIPHCCPPHHALLPDGNCSKDINVPTLTPPVSVYEMEVVWQSEGEVESPVAPVSCPGKETLELGLGDRVSLMYSPLGLLLHWLPPMRHQPSLTPDFCLGVSTDHEYRARVCFSDPKIEHWDKCRGVTCVRKCCQEGQKFEGIQCVPVVDNETLSWHPEFYEKGSLKPGASPPSDLTIIHGMPLCTSFFLLEAHKSDEDRYYLQVDGTLHVPNFQRDFPAENYCLEFFDTENDTALLPLICFEDQDRCKDVQAQAYPVLLGFSCIFLAITLLVYVSVPELHAKVHGKCLVSHVTALLLAYLSLIIVQRTTDTMPDVACKVMASITHISFLAAFFWLNVMCFDIWWTLK
ncbi:hypothetical protein Pmani_026038 [Petrolisthes manimaculis]|uniref:Methuselah N-terminal domain-containing protein n=1 Tax=Petrolisthes manimaculis TaxID=1843537 RepID=A0AAE1TXT7_9EUCA|nr:hypothetical protein Pmani_026038 [Petrolisthes manimaculis]